MRRWLSRLSDSALVLFVLLGLAALPFYKADALRERFVGAHAIAPGSTTAVLLVSLAIAVFSLLRRNHVWTNPAQLTWDDHHDRDRLLRRRLWTAVVARFAAVAYVFVSAGLILGWPDNLPLAGALIAASALFGYRWSNRPQSWVELGGPFLLALAGVLFAGPVVLWAVVAVLVVAAVPSGRPVRRDVLVRGWNARILRSVSAAFGDALALLPPARPIRVRPTNPLRFAVAGALARRSALPFAGLVLLAIPVLRHAFPVVGSIWWVGLGAYLSTVPFAGGLAEVVRTAGLRRWVPTSTRVLKLAAFAVLTVAAALWGATVVLLGFPFVPLAVPLVAWAVVRTVSRPDIDYTAGVSTDVGGLYLPVGLVFQVLRGPDLLLFGLLVLGYFHSS
ncbi:hypothetical protein [Actinokineospora terrae]|uniref:ABC-2 type transport system permease protein n=1 Tax=Actinokineospora terrae TaxID=155974 RepID=A0A1H9W1Y8_9PSEU|nr:hypothetical protein [Actinokineospora terrae]SES27936.1 hypothetical protein SAMN04487818_109294 [Actinokineospora terrae]